MTATSQRTQISETSWEVKRTATLDEVRMENGGLTYHVQVRDGDRKPFLTRWFQDPVSAGDFIDTVKLGMPSGRSRRG